ncbi:MAG: hypothetical protein PHE94_01175 [Eubacteriales bacterium]|nr:hypothetical protein [Eubacteriales bacterium]
MNERISEPANNRYSKTGELRCAICGSISHVIRFKNGYICVNCLQHVKTI